MWPKLLRAPRYEQGTKDDREQEGKIKSKAKYNLLNKVVIEMDIQTQQAVICSNRWPEKKLSTA